MVSNNKIVITVAAVTQRDGVARKTGNKYHLEEAACIAWAEYADRDGQIKRDTTGGLMLLPDLVHGLPAGEYEPVISVGQYEGKVVFRIVDLKPVGQRASMPQPEKKAA
ncbi:hypothetical protein [Cupriavidus metallidurans]|uniref:hypothetical protein n=1 Tax=Cupriavidus metallidurans TaxID=119219 RepID=UPI0017DE5136|nr:hypothetical protein [Myxococcales bacterium]